MFRRLLLRFAVVTGLASSILVWSPAPLAGCLVFVVAFAMLTTAASLRHQRGAQAARAGLTTARVSVNVVAAVAVVDLAGITGVLLVATCVALSDGARAWIAPPRPARRPAPARRARVALSRAPATRPAPVPLKSPTTTKPTFLTNACRRRWSMSNLSALLEDALTIEGALGVALVDAVSGLPLGAADEGSRLRSRPTAAGGTGVVRAMRRTLDGLRLGDDEGIEDLLVTTRHCTCCASCPVTPDCSSAWCSTGTAPPWEWRGSGWPDREGGSSCEHPPQHRTVPAHPRRRVPRPAAGRLRRAVRRGQDHPRSSRCAASRSRAPTCRGSLVRARAERHVKPTTTVGLEMGEWTRSPAAGRCPSSARPARSASTWYGVRRCRAAPASCCGCSATTSRPASMPRLWLDFIAAEVPLDKITIALTRLDGQDLEAELDAFRQIVDRFSPAIPLVAADPRDADDVQTVVLAALRGPALQVVEQAG